MTKYKFRKYHFGTHPCNGSWISIAIPETSILQQEIGFECLLHGWTYTEAVQGTWTCPLIELDRHFHQNTNWQRLDEVIANFFRLAVIRLRSEDDGFVFQ